MRSRVSRTRGAIRLNGHAYAILHPRPKNQFGTVLEDPAIRWQRHSASTGGSRSLRRARLSLFLVEQRPADRGALPPACETSRPESESDVGIGAVSSPALAGTPVA